jgi:hypothetical protein
VVATQESTFAPRETGGTLPSTPVGLQTFEQVLGQGDRYSYSSGLLSTCSEEPSEESCSTSMPDCAHSPTSASAAELDSGAADDQPSMPTPPSMVGPSRPLLKGPLGASPSAHAATRTCATAPRASSVADAFERPSDATLVDAAARGGAALQLASQLACSAPQQQHIAVYASVSSSCTMSGSALAGQSLPAALSEARGTLEALPDVQPACLHAGGATLLVADSKGKLPVFGTASSVSGDMKPSASGQDMASAPNPDQAACRNQSALPRAVARQGDAAERRDVADNGANLQRELLQANDSNNCCGAAASVPDAVDKRLRVNAMNHRLDDVEATLLDTSGKLERGQGVAANACIPVGAEHGEVRWRVHGGSMASLALLG